METRTGYFFAMGSPHGVECTQEVEMGILLNTARNAARDGILSTREVGQLISQALTDGKVTRGEVEDLKKVQSELASELTPEARRAINNFLSLGSSFDPGLAGVIFGVTDEQVDKLEKAGVKTPMELLLKAKTPAERSKLANLAGIDEVLVTSLAEQVDLARIIGIGPKYAAILQKIGVNDIGELSEQNPVALRRQIASFLNTTEGRAIATRRPSLNTVKGWVQASKTLPRMIRREGQGGADFNKASFEALKKEEKALLLFGFDVHIPSGFVFDASHLSVSEVRRKPAEIGAAVKTLIDSNFDGEYETSELLSTEVIKVGDEILGYRLVFEVATESGGDSESGGDVRMRGTVDVALLPNGEVLEMRPYLDEDYNHE
jgi:hypothetical protein